MNQQKDQATNKVKKIIAKIFPHLLLPTLIMTTFFLSGFFIKESYNIATALFTIAITLATPKVINLSKLIEFINNDKIDNRSILEVRLLSSSIIAISSYISGKLQSAFYIHFQENSGVLLALIGTNVFHQAMFHLLEDGFNIDCYRALGVRIKENIKENFDLNMGFLSLMIRGLPANEILKIEKKITFKEPIVQPSALNPPAAK